MDCNDSSITSDHQEVEEPVKDDNVTETSLELMSPEQEAVHKRRLELKRTQQDLIKLVNRLHEFVNRDRNAVASDSSSCGDVSLENSEEDGVDWELLTNYVNQHVTELQEIRSLSSFTGLLLNRIKKIISGPVAGEKKEHGDGNSDE